MFRINAQPVANNKQPGQPGSRDNLNRLILDTDQLRFRLLMMTTPLHVPVLRQFALAPPHIFEQYSGDELKVFLPLVQFPWHSKAMLEQDLPAPSY